jgi:hypothetical protein
LLVEEHFYTRTSTDHIVNIENFIRESKFQCSRGGHLIYMTPMAIPVPPRLYRWDAEEAADPWVQQDRGRKVGAFPQLLKK